MYLSACRQPGLSDTPGTPGCCEYTRNFIYVNRCFVILAGKNIAMRYKIHRADLGCLDTQMALTRLQKQCLPYDKPATTTFGYWWLVHSEDGVPVAFAGLVPSQRWSDCGYLCRAGVLPTHRGQGIQKKLIRVRIRQARALGWNWLVTDTNDNPASANSLIARGFKMFDPTKPWGADKTLYWRFKL